MIIGVIYNIINLIGLYGTMLLVMLKSMNFIC